MSRLYINPRYQQLLNRHQLSTEKQLLGDSVSGDIIEHGAERSTFKVELEGNGFFLKQVRKKSYLSALEPLLQLQKPHHYAWREMQHVLNLQKAGIDVMEVVAACEHTRWGIPVASAIMVAQVDGADLESVFIQATREQQHLLLQRLGALTGRLHLAGFFGTVRLKDVFIDRKDSYVLIDREARNPQPQAFSEARALQGLERFLHRQRRDYPAWCEDDSRSYLQGYLQETSDSLPLPLDEVLDRVS
ncbi:MAG: lipopolysaccharide kinase InaA family protein [Halieaceae bacterium]